MDQQTIDFLGYLLVLFVRKWKQIKVDENGGGGFCVIFTAGVHARC